LIREFGLYAAYSCMDYRDVGECYGDYGLKSEYKWKGSDNGVLHGNVLIVTTKINTAHLFFFVKIFLLIDISNTVKKQIKSNIVKQSDLNGNLTSQ
jgi:hypothetical protein